ncbi:hypothetical protein KY329_01255 [Candidatus Woesearchaeota archaeon]|nr:hypothetical protein [Candidatus Woesearchaeota archaeon]
MAKIKHLLKDWRVIILIFFLVLGAFAIHPNPWNNGVAIKAIEKNSSAAIAGIEPPKERITPMDRERVTAINNKIVNNLADYYKLIEEIQVNQTVKVTTNEGTYKLTVKPILQITELNQTKTIIKNITHEVNETVQVNGTNITKLVNKTVTESKEVPVVKKEIIGVAPLGLNVVDAPTTNIRKGLDLQGGTRVLLKPTEETTAETMDLIVDSLKERLNVYGLGDIVVTKVSDAPDFMHGNTYILVEIAGATEEEVKDLVSKQGKFESKIKNETVFIGGDDITYVCRTAECSGLDPRQACGRTEEGWGCAFRFGITLSPEAAERQAAVTKTLKVVGQYLEEPIVLYLDGEKVDELKIAADLRGRAVTEIEIKGSGFGTTEEAAAQDALKSMKRLQTILITGSLPVKLDIERIDNISPKLGEEFLSNAFLVALVSIIAVVIVLLISYRRFALALPVMVTSLSEVYLILSMAALIGWNLDLAAIAGIILAVGTGVDDQIVILDEALKGEAHTAYNWKQRIKRAFFIIMSAYATTVVAMTPLLFAGAGLLKGFAITTILGVSIGVFITRPAFAAIAKWVLDRQ